MHRKGENIADSRKRMLRHARELNCLSCEDKQKEKRNILLDFHSVMFTGV
jgi:hypothetical protein